MSEKLDKFAKSSKLMACLRGEEEPFNYNNPIHIYRRHLQVLQYIDDSTSIKCHFYALRATVRTFWFRFKEYRKRKKAAKRAEMLTINRIPMDEHEREQFQALLDGRMFYATNAFCKLHGLRQQPLLTRIRLWIREYVYRFREWRKG